MRNCLICGVELHVHTLYTDSMCTFCKVGYHIVDFDLSVFDESDNIEIEVDELE